jgi:hypothetical protein
MLGCIQPMSSPMMNMMLGFYSCARAGNGAAMISTSDSATRHAERRFRVCIGPLLFGRARPTTAVPWISITYSPSCCFIIASIFFFTASRLKEAGSCIGG